MNIFLLKYILLSLRPSNGIMQMSSNPSEEMVTFALYKDRQQDFCNIYAGPSKIQTYTLPTQTYSVKQERALSFSETLILE